MIPTKRLVQFIRSLPGVLALLTALAVAASAADPNNPFVGHWALTVPGGGAGWLGITAENGYYDGSILWVAGSVEPVDSVFIVDNTLHLTRTRDVQRKDASGKVARTQRFTDLITATADGGFWVVRIEGQVRQYLQLDAKNTRHGLAALSLPLDDAGRAGTTGARLVHPSDGYIDIAPYYCTLGSATGGLTPAQPA